MLWRPPAIAHGWQYAARETACDYLGQDGPVDGLEVTVRVGNSRRFLHVGGECGLAAVRGLRRADRCFARACTVRLENGRLHARHLQKRVIAPTTRRVGIRCGSTVRRRRA